MFLLRLKKEFHKLSQKFSDRYKKHEAKIARLEEKLDKQARKNKELHAWINGSPIASSDNAGSDDSAKSKFRQPLPHPDALSLLINEWEVMRLNFKTLGYEMARHLVNDVMARVDYSHEPQVYNLPSKPTTQADVESAWFAFWCHELKIAPLYHRKLWEYAFVLQSLWEEGLITSGKTALGFGCGTEPLPSYFASKGIKVVATDLAPEKSDGLGWTTTNQHTTDLEAILKPELCDRETFLQMTTLEYVDMNDIPTTLHEQYDFVWSICALEHLGSIANGLRFIEESVKCLKPGGVAIHTTEYNYQGTDQTLDHGGTVLFLRKHFEEIAARLQAIGCELTMDFDIGTGVLDRFIDLPPYHTESGEGSGLHNGASLGLSHLKMTVLGTPSTCYGLRIKRG